MSDEHNNADVYVINADGSRRTALTSNLADDMDPRWSPDGAKITFASDRDGGDFDIYTVDADGSDVAQVTNSRNWEGEPDWQPLPGPTKAKSERQHEERQQSQHQPKQVPKSHSVTGHLKDTGGPSLVLVASALLISGGVLFYAGLKRRM